MVVLAIAALGTVMAQEKHPRILVTPERIQEMKTAIAVPGSTHAEAFKALEGRVTKGITAYSGSYGPAYLATEAAFHYLLTNDKKSADIAYEAFKQSFAGGTTPLTGMGLARATMSKGVGLAYDWCYTAWSDEQRQFAREKIKSALDAWPSFGHPNLGGNRASNWAGVCRGGELLLLLAAGDEVTRVDRYKMLKSELRRHIEAAYSTDSGWCNEGTSYLDYAGQYVVPAVLALRSVGDTDLDKVFDARPFWKLIMFSRSFALASYYPDCMVSLSSGVDTTAIGSEGYASLLAAVTPKDSLGYYRWFYDHNMGQLSPLRPQARYDWSRDGTVWCLLYYPEGVESQNPTGKLKPYLSDTSKGVFYFRNRWKDADDVLFLAVANNRVDGGWNVPEALQINLIAGGTSIFGGPSKDGGGGKKPEKFSKLLVDGKVADARGGNGTFTPSPTGGYVVLDGGACYQKSGVTVKRHILVNMTGEPSAALIATVDDITAEADHKYAYNLALSNPMNDGGLKPTAGTEAGRPTFTIVTPTGGYCKGWVLAPAEATVRAGDPTAADIAAKSTRIFVVMAAGNGTPPTATIAGTGMDTAITVAGKTFKWDAAKNCIVCE